MAIETYSDLKAAIADWLNRSDLATQIPDFIRLAELDIYRRLRVRGAEKAINTTLSAGVVAVPADFAEAKHLYIDGSPSTPLEWVSVAWLMSAYPTRSASGMPGYVAQDGGNFVFGPYPDADYTLKGTYYARQTALSTSNETNWLTREAPDALLYGALWHARGFLHDDARIPAWRAIYEEAIAALKREGRNADYGAGPIMIQAS